MAGQDRKTSELTAAAIAASTDMVPGYRPGSPNIDIQLSVAKIRRENETVAASTAFTPFQTIWLFEMTCDAAGSATVTLSGVRRDTGATETVATYSLIASQVLVDTNDRADHVSFSWTKTGTGAVTVRVL